jgi:hypothetical protein
MEPGHAGAAPGIKRINLSPGFPETEAIFDAAGQEAGVTAGAAIQIK